MVSKVPFSITNHIRLLLFSCLSLNAQASPLISSKSAYRQRWRMPDGSLPNRTQSIVIGQTIEVSWRSLNDSVNDLWFTPSKRTEGDTLAHLVAENIDISKDGSYTWTVDWPDTIPDASKSYTFDFLPATEIKDYASLVEEKVPVIRSPDILVVDNSNFSPILKTPLSPSSSSSSSSSSSPSFSKSSPLSAITVAAAKADITINDSSKQTQDVLIVAALVLGILCFFSFGVSAYVFVRNRRRRSKKAQCGEDDTSSIVMARRMSSILWD